VLLEAAVVAVVSVVAQLVRLVLAELGAAVRDRRATLPQQTEVQTQVVAAVVAAMEQRQPLAVPA
jgi:hypothetical protein